MVRYYLSVHKTRQLLNFRETVTIFTLTHTLFLHRFSYSTNRWYSLLTAAKEKNMHYLEHRHSSSLYILFQFIGRFITSHNIHKKTSKPYSAKQNLPASARRTVFTEGVRANEQMIPWNFQVGLLFLLKPPNTYSHTIRRHTTHTHSNAKWSLL